MKTNNGYIEENEVDKLIKMFRDIENLCSLLSSSSAKVHKSMHRYREARDRNEYLSARNKRNYLNKTLKDFDQTIDKLLHRLALAGIITTKLEVDNDE